MNKRRRWKAKARRRARRLAPTTGTPIKRHPTVTAEQLWVETDALLNDRGDADDHVMGALKSSGGTTTINFHPLSISMIDDRKRFQLDGFYWRPLTMVEVLDRNDRDDWRGCRMIGLEPCIIDGIAPDR